MPAKKTIRRIPIKPPAGIKRTAVHKKTTKRGGMIPAALIPVLAAAGIPLATAAGTELVKGVKYGVSKVRKLLGIGVVRSGKGVIRSGATRAQGGLRKKKAVRRVIIRI